MSSDQLQPNHDKIGSILGAVLTGGRSRRMGRDKAAIVVENRSLAERAVAVLAEVFSDVVVVSNGNPAHLGFGVPVGDWIRGPLRDWAEDLLQPQSLDYFDAAEVQARWQEHLRGERDWQHHLWDVLMFQAWLQAR